MKSYAKINIFLKIISFRQSYHEISSRFLLCKTIFDEIDFIKRDSKDFICGCDIEDNIILKAKKELENNGYKNQLDEFFQTHQVLLIKRIPQGGGLGGGSSNAATFLHLINDELNLHITNEKLLKIGKNIGADVAFFLSKFDSANVNGIGEIISEFKEEIPKIELIFTKIHCKTADVFRKFRQDFCKFDINLAKKLEKLSSEEILKTYDNYILNDLLKPCMSLYETLNIQKNEFLSGSGGTKFKLVL